MRYPVFLSSLTSGLFECAKGLRREIYWRAGLGRYIYVDEEIQQRDVALVDPPALIDELLERISQAEVFLCVLAGSSHGSRIVLDQHHSAVSFFELEVFAAALMRKRIVLLRHASFDPEQTLAGVLTALGFAFPTWNQLEKLDDTGIVADAARAVETVLPDRGRWQRPWQPQPVQRIAQAMFLARGRRGAASTFLCGQSTMPYEPEPNLPWARKRLHDCQQEANQQRILSHLWLVIRELNTPGVLHRGRGEEMSLLEQALDRWAGAGAWYGLHADTGLGCLAAVNTIGVIRAARNRLGDLPKDVPVRPSGALASAKFNIAKHLHSWSHQRWLLRSALKDINEAIVLERQDPSGLLAVKASINRRLGNVFEAVNGLEHSLRVRRANGTPEKDLGASLSELGFACLFAFRARQGLKHCEDGVQRLRDAEADSTDLARALRKLAVAALVNGRVRDYREARDEADTLAKNVAAQDQVR